MAAISFLETYHREVDRVILYAGVVIHSCLLVSVLVICGSYLPDLQVHNRNLTERNLRLSRTFFIVVAVSLVFWLPIFVAYVIKEFCWGCISTSVASRVKVLHLANSMVNPFVYSFRMPIFKAALKERRRRPRTIELRAVGVNISSKDRETRLYHSSNSSLVQYKLKES